VEIRGRLIIVAKVGLRNTSKSMLTRFDLNQAQLCLRSAAFRAGDSSRNLRL
jgi:hypothetical protein